LGEEFGELSYIRPMGVMRVAETKGIGEAGFHASKCVHAGNCKETYLQINIPQVIH